MREITNTPKNVIRAVLDGADNKVKFDKVEGKAFLKVGTITLSTRAWR